MHCSNGKEGGWSELYPQPVFHSCSEAFQRHSKGFLIVSMYILQFPVGKLLTSALQQGQIVSIATLGIIHQ